MRSSVKFLFYVGKQRVCWVESSRQFRLEQGMSESFYSSPENLLDALVREDFKDRLSKADLQTVLEIKDLFNQMKSQVVDVCKEYVMSCVGVNRDGK